jgi:hypothetical protein
MASSDLPKKYKAIIYDKPGSISTKIEELDMPEPGPGEVLINLCVSLSTTFLPILPNYVSPSVTTSLIDVGRTQASATPIWAS